MNIGRLGALVIVAIALKIAPLKAQTVYWCSDANLNPTERTICRSPLLRCLDVELNAVYNGEKREAQRNWLSNERDRCGSDVDCIAERVRIRIAQLERERGLQPSEACAEVRPLAPDNAECISRVPIVQADTGRRGVECTKRNGEIQYYFD